MKEKYNRLNFKDTIEMNTDFSPSTASENKTTRQPKHCDMAQGAKKLLPMLYCIIVPIIMGICLYTYEKETLFRIQELNLFLPGSLFYHDFAGYPGGTLQWAACFLTQFFYYPALGTAMLTALWIANCLVMRSAFRLSPLCCALTMLLPAALLGGIVQMGYFIYYIRLQGYFFTASLGMLTALSAVWAFRRVMTWQPYTGYGWIAIWTAVGYPLFGAYALAGTGYMLILCWRMHGHLYVNRIIPTAIGLLFVLGVPLLAYHIYAQTSISDIYTAALPSFNVDVESYPQYRIPYYILFATPLIGAVCYNWSPPLRKRVLPATHLLLLAAVAVWLQKTWYTDGNFRKELLMARAIENEEWDKIPAIFVSDTAEPTRLMVMNKNLALFRLGRAGNEMYQYREGGARPNAPFLVRLSHVGGKALYYHYGQENYCYRWCMEDGVVFGWRVEYLKYMAKTSIVNGDYQVARKYLNLLKQTLFHKAWATKYEALLNHPETIPAHPEFQPILAMLPEENSLNTDLNVIEMFLLKTFAYSNSDNPYRQEQCLIAALQMKDIGLFWPRFFKYATLHPDIHMPRHYQEAAYLYGHLEHQVDISHMPFDEEVKESYRRFMEFTQQCSGMTEEQMAEAFRPQFGNTFYYFYFLVNGLQTY